MPLKWKPKKPTRKVASALNPKQRAFLAAYAVCGVISEAADAAKVGRRSHYDWIDGKEYAAAFKYAHRESCEALEIEARIRATRGVAEPVIYQGQLCFEPLRDKRTGQILRDKKGNPRLSTTPLVVYKKDSTLLMFIMKRLMPEYRESFKHDVSGAVDLKFKGSMGELLDTYRQLIKGKAD